MREMYLYPPSNTDLAPERLWNYELSWRHHINAFNYGLNLYYIKGDNMIQTIPVDGKPRNVNTGEIENYGAELEAQYRINSQSLEGSRGQVIDFFLQKVCEFP